MKMMDLEGKNIVIWGTGREGLAAGAFIKKNMPAAKITFVDEAGGVDITTALKSADIVVKSPGVSLYHPLLCGKHVTSLMNLWFAQGVKAKTICISGTKGKSTTSSLLGHVLERLGHKVAVLGNIGVPLSEAPDGMDYLVIETSSYQAANFDGRCDIAAITSLYPEHLDWHGDYDVYARDKIHLLGQADIKIIHEQVRDAGVALPQSCVVCKNFDGAVSNAYLARTHNRANVAIVLAIADALGLSQHDVLEVMQDFEGLPHRQQELGIKDGILYVDDSIATTPQAAMAAMDVYRDKALTLIVGGYDRGIDYAPLVTYLKQNKICAVIGLGASGARIMRDVGGPVVDSMADAVKLARSLTPVGGVILLSPAAPSFGLFKNYIERGQTFAQEGGF